MADDAVINLVNDEVANNGEERAENVLNEQHRQRTLMVSVQMREVSVSDYLPGITQINLVTEEHQTVEEALTMAGDHFTPCERCSMNDPDGCFWIVTSFHLHMLGQQVKHRNSVMRNSNIQYYLYGQFVDDEYDYLHGPKEM